MQSTCDECGAGFEKRMSRQRFCSDRCRYMAKDRRRMFPCSVCGELMHRGGTTRGIGESAHNRCRIEQAGHGVTRYNKYGCRCEVCRSAASEAVTRWNRKSGYQSRPEVVSRRKERRAAYREQDRARWRRYAESNSEALKVAWNEKSARRKGAPTVPFTSDQLQARLSMYAGCWICGCALGERFHVDHVKPLARGGWHCLSNLRPSCPSCNISKGAKWPLSELGTLRDSSRG